MFRPLIAAPLAMVLLSAAPSWAEEAGGPPPAMVGYAEPVKRKVTEHDVYTGRFEAVERVELRAQVSGYLTEVGFEDGEIVEKGRVLFRIDPRPAEAALAQAKANLGSAEAAAALAGLELNRAGRLSKGVTISAAEFDTKAQAKAQADASVAAAKAAVDNAQLTLDYTTIKAPITGRVSAAEVTPGNYVVAAQTLLTTLVSQDPIRFVFDADEAAYLKYARMRASGSRLSARDSALPVHVGLMDEKEFPHEGRMDFVDNVLDQSTGTIRGRAVFQNKEQLFIPGMFGRIQIDGSGEYDAILVPEQALVSNANGKMLMVVGKDNVIAPTPVEVGARIDGWRVIKSGLTGTERVVVSGTNKAIPGLPVTPALAIVDPQNGSVTVPPPPQDGGAPGQTPAEDKPADDKPAEAAAK